jgi:hypothetical protein
MDAGPSTQRQSKKKLGEQRRAAKKRRDKKLLARVATLVSSGRKLTSEGGR